MKALIETIFKLSANDKATKVFKILFVVFTFNSLVMFLRNFQYAHGFFNFVYAILPGLMLAFQLLVLWDLKNGNLFRELNVKRLKWIALIIIPLGLLNIYSVYTFTHSLDGRKVGMSVSQAKAFFIQSSIDLCLDFSVLFFFWLGLSFLLAEAIRLHEDHQLTV